MPRMIDLIRASKLPSNMMQFAAKGALSVPPDENLEILVYLAKHNKIFGDLARITLAGWDEKTSLAAAASPKTAPEVLDYLILPENIRPALLPALLENAAVTEDQLARFAISASPESITVMLQSQRVRAAEAILRSLRANPYLKGAEASLVAELLSGGKAKPETVSDANAVEASEAVPSAEAEENAPEPASVADDEESGVAVEGESGVPDEEVSAYLAANAAEIAAEQDKKFQPVGGILDLLGADYFPVSEIREIDAVAQPAVSTGGAAAAAAPARTARGARPEAADGAKRENTLQKINNLDVKGRIQLALKGNKEERSILIRDGTKVVALAVLDAPKITDGEVEKFALQKNVLEAVLRQIPLKRRFMKNYIIVRNLVSNPRTPLDLSLGLMKHLQAPDLKNLSANKEISDTVRKLALKMYKQKMETASKK